ncbi:acetyl-CoA hydrolase/transferase family protein [Aequoribacter sp.]|uniref:acetyl-CoA hydrolase/transferase family protein n=1 Tax=Aequoribacter sp. TaxID=2847771 RepID=UPI003F69DBCE
MKLASSAQELMQLIQSGNRVWCHSMAATPVPLLDALAQRALELQDLTVMQLHLEHAESICTPELQGHLRNRCFFAGESTRALINSGQADYVPLFLSELPKRLRSGDERVDVAMIQVSQPDAHGNCSLGISVEATAAAVQSASKVVAMINPQMPRTHGDSFVNIRQIDTAIECDWPLIEHPYQEPTEIQQAIGRNIAGLIDDGDCLQMGIGGVPDAVLEQLADRKDLGVHTEMFSNALPRLIELGVVTNSRKKKQRGKSVTGFVMGNRALYDFVDDNPSVAFLDIEYVNDPTIIARNDQVVSINSALQVDLSGQVCADSLGTQIYSGVGGQVDFVTGAGFSKGGKSIIALPSTAKGGAMSRIVPTLAAGSGVVTTRAQVDFVVTEFGVAKLKGLSLRERAEVLISIAHPDFRDGLSSENSR